MAEHELKTWPDFFDAIARGDKTFEVRKNDRGFQKGDVLVLRKWDPSPIAEGNWTMKDFDPPPRGYCEDEPLRMRVTYVMSGFGIENGYVVMGIENEDKRVV